MTELTCEHARELFEYDNVTGKLYRKFKFGKIKETGYIGSHGYLQVKFDRRVYLVHRLIFLISYGELPSPNLQVNHINEVKTDNRLENLEPVTSSQNINHGTRNHRAAETLSKPLFCTTNGVLYKSQTVAARELKIRQNRISEHINGGRTHVDGYQFEESAEEVEG